MTSHCNNKIVPGTKVLVFIFTHICKEKNSVSKKKTKQKTICRYFKFHKTLTAFLRIYSTCDVNYGFSVTAVSVTKQPLRHATSCHFSLVISYGERLNVVFTIRLKFVQFCVIQRKENRKIEQFYILYF